MYVEVLIETVISNNLTLSISPNAMGSPKPARKLRKMEINFYDAIRPAIIVSRIFALLPYTISGNIERATVGVFNAIYCVVSIAVILAFSFLVLFSSDTNFYQDSATLFVTDWLFAIYALIMWLVLVVLDMLNRNRLVEVIKEIVNFDNNVSKSL